MSHYQKPPELYEGLRLHQNENTGGCSPRVIEAIARLRPDQIGFYPPYAAATAAVATYLGVSAEKITLLNGLDEGIMALAVACLRAGIGGPQLEAIVPEPAFEIFRFDTAVAGGRLVQVMPRADFSFPLDEVLAAITPNTRVVFVTNPNNPTGVDVPLEAIRAIARRIPPGAVVFVDEAYAEFAGVSFIPELDAFPNVVVGRTFSKAFGLAGLRIGCLVAAPATRRRGAARGAGLQRQRRRGGGGDRRARRPRSPERLPARGRRVEGAAVRGVRSARPGVREEQVELRARARRRTGRTRS